MNTHHQPPHTISIRVFDWVACAYPNTIQSFHVKRYKVVCAQPHSTRRSYQIVRVEWCAQNQTPHTVPIKLCKLIGVRTTKHHTVSLSKSVSECTLPQTDYMHDGGTQPKTMYPHMTVAHNPRPHHKLTTCMTVAHNPRPRTHTWRWHTTQDHTTNWLHDGGTQPKTTYLLCLIWGEDLNVLQTRCSEEDVRTQQFVCLITDEHSRLSVWQLMSSSNIPNANIWGTASSHTSDLHILGIEVTHTILSARRLKQKVRMHHENNARVGFHDIRSSPNTQVCHSVTQSSITFQLHRTHFNHLSINQNIPSTWTFQKATTHQEDFAVRPAPRPEALACQSKPVWTEVVMRVGVITVGRVWMDCVAWTICEHSHDLNPLRRGLDHLHGWDHLYGLRCMNHLRTFAWPEPLRRGLDHLHGRDHLHGLHGLNPLRRGLDHLRGLDLYMHRMAWINCSQPFYVKQ